MPEHFIPPHGGYEDLISFQKARIVYDGTVRFCARFLRKSDRTSGQMIQAARSGKQNILEGSQASATSKETEIKLTSVARASLEELIEDYRDFLRGRGIKEWTKNHPNTRRLRQLNRQPDATYETFQKGIEHPDPAIAANVMIGMIKVTSYLLDRQLEHLEAAFLKEGGLRERMTRARLAQRAKSGRPWASGTHGSKAPRNYAVGEGASRMRASATPNAPAAKTRGYSRSKYQSRAK